MTRSTIHDLRTWREETPTGSSLWQHCCSDNRQTCSTPEIPFPNLNKDAGFPPRQVAMNGHSSKPAVTTARLLGLERTLPSEYLFHGLIITPEARGAKALVKRCDILAPYDDSTIVWDSHMTIARGHRHMTCHVTRRSHLRGFHVGTR